MDKIINYNLTRNENLILEALWKENKPLTRSGILDSIADKDFNENSFYKFLNGLLDKKIIREGEIVRTGKSYGRTYLPNITKDEYDLYQMEKINEIINPNDTTEVSFIMNMIKTRDFTDKDIEQLEEIIENKKTSKVKK